jgi:methionyl-tRNA formyltransferase
LTGERQGAAGVTYAAKLDKAEAVIDWRRPAAALARAVRAYDPFPGAVARVDGQAVKVWCAEPAPGAGEPGLVLAAGAEGIVVACGEGALRLTELQKSGGKRLPAADFLRGFALKPGQRFVLAAD